MLTWQLTTFFLIGWAPILWHSAHFTSFYIHLVAKLNKYVFKNCLMWIMGTACHQQLFVGGVQNWSSRSGKEEWLYDYLQLSPQMMVSFILSLRLQWQLRFHICSLRNLQAWHNRSRIRKKLSTILLFNIFL